MKCVNLLVWGFGQRQAEHADRRPECFASEAEASGGRTLRGAGIQETVKQKRKMSLPPLILHWFASILFLGGSMSANAGLFGIGGTSWKEEVLLHDGIKILVNRSVVRGGRHEIGQQPPFKEQSLSFSLPGTNRTVTWEDRYSEDLGSANFLPMLLDVFNGIPFVVTTPMGCLAYNKWGQPNPPYVIFKQDGKEWNRISLEELPSEIKVPNLIISDPDINPAIK